MSSNRSDDSSLLRQVNGELDQNEAMKRALNLSKAQSCSQEEHKTRTKGKPLCRFYFTPYGCMKGYQCLFRHDEDTETGMSPEESHRVRTAGAALCRFFSSPTGCQYGFSCAYSHVVKRSTSSSGSAQHGEEDKESSSKDDDDSDEKCSICLECPSGTVGLMQNCDHVFCMECISKWRSKASADGDTSVEHKRTCPICRKKSFFVVPSSRPLKGKLRESAIESFKLVCSSRPCKNFVRRRHVCVCVSSSLQHFREKLRSRTKTGTTRGQQLHKTKSILQVRTQLFLRTSKQRWN